MNLHIYYRISDKGRPKEKLCYTNKFICLKNAIREFGKENFYIIADNCSTETIEFIRLQGVSFEETSLGNAMSFLYTIDKILKNHSNKDFVYLIEDDYIHRKGSKNILIEGLKIANYVTLYDHPDKYYLASSNRVLGGGGGVLNGNSFNYKKLQKTRLYITKCTHWRETNSTTMTFACQILSLQNDYMIWKKFCSLDKTPKDFHAFITITQKSLFDTISFFIRGNRNEFKIMFKNIFALRKVKKLISPVPSYSTHTEIPCIAPFIDWESEK